MRISDCSSDVGSSDLPEPEKSAPRPAPEPQQGAHADQPKLSLIHSLRPGRLAARAQQKVGAPPCRQARSYFARAPAVKFQVRIHFVSGKSVSVHVVLCCRSFLKTKIAFFILSN